MENIIYNELITRGYNVDVGMVEIKKQDKDGKWVRIQLEVDFIASLGSKKYGSSDISSDAAVVQCI